MQGHGIDDLIEWALLADERIGRIEVSRPALRAMRLDLFRDDPTDHRSQDFLRSVLYPESGKVYTLCERAVVAVHDCDPPIRLREKRDPCVWGADA